MDPTHHHLSSLDHWIDCVFIMDGKDLLTVDLRGAPPLGRSHYLIGRHNWYEPFELWSTNLKARIKLTIEVCNW